MYTTLVWLRPAFGCTFGAQAAAAAAWPAWLLLCGLVPSAIILFYSAAKSHPTDDDDDDDFEEKRKKERSECGPKRSLARSTTASAASISTLHAAFRQSGRICDTFGSIEIVLLQVTPIDAIK